MTMGREIEPGTGVAVFRLPMPMNGLQLINDALHRIYGTGEWMLTFNGDQIQANAPAEGFGPVKTGRKSPMPKSRPEEKVAHIKARSGKLEVTLEQAQEVVVQLMDTTHLWFSEVGGINYVEFSLQGQDGTEQPYVYCVQQRDGATPHTKRQEAEAEAARLRLVLEQVRDLELGRWDGSQMPLPTVAELVESALEEPHSAQTGDPK